jgi:hypothetical protein
MKCENCGKDLIIPSRAYLNLESYNVGGSIMTASDCCGAGYVVKMKVSYQVTKYTGDKTEDEWGTKLTTKEKTQ